MTTVHDPIAKTPIRILHLVDDFSTANTGVTATVRQIAQWQARHCAWVGIHATGSIDLPSPKGVTVINTPAHRLTPSWRYPAMGVPGLLALIDAHQVTHLHIHEFWRGGYICGMLAAKRRHLPTILSAHGTTAPWALRGQGMLKTVKKWVYWNGFGRIFLDPAVALHAITPLEGRHMAQFFGRDPRAVIPNAIDLDAISANVDSPTAPPKRRFVFLGRLHPVKGVDFLIQAFGAAELSGDWELIIAGPEEIPAYAHKIKTIAAATPKANRIRFIGPVYGADKTTLLRSAWAVVVPSKTEVIGMVNLEAASLATPTITTPNTGLDEWAQVGGVLANDTLSEIRSALEASAVWSMDERLQRGALSQVHVKQHYVLNVVGQEWLRLYCDIGLDRQNDYGHVR